MNSIDSKGKWVIAPEMVGFYLVAFIGFFTILGVILS